MTATAPVGELVRPASVEEVVAELARARREGLGVLPVGSGRHVGRAAGRQRWIALSTERLSGIEIYEPADLTLTAGAGTPMREVSAALAANDQFAPFDPPFVLERSLGGLVADGASGPLWTGYGELRNHVLGLTVVTGDGRVLRLGGRVVKNVAGFDLIKPMTGSRGSLGVIVSVCLRAFPLPAEDRLLVLEGADVASLLDVARGVGTAPVLPVSSVIVGGALLVRLHGAGSTVDSDQRTIERHVGRTFTVPDAPSAGARLARARDAAAAADTVLELSVRPSRLPDLWPSVAEATPSEAVVDTYAGRVRVGFETLDRAAASRLTEAAERLGGAASVVRSSDPDVASAGSRPSDAEELLTGRLRDAFDPDGVLWPARR